MLATVPSKLAKTTSRNFEYFSEDPLLTGEFTKAATLGMHKGGASGTITLQQSADGSFWDDLPNATAVPVPLNDSVTLEDDFLSGRYIRAIYAETTAGNLSLILTQKS